MSTFFPIEISCTCSLSLNCHLVGSFSVTPVGLSLPVFSLSHLDVLFCKSKNQDALSVWIWSDDQMKADWFHWGFQRLWGVYWILRQRKTGSSQIGNHRHQHCAAAASFGRERLNKITVEKSQINSQWRKVGKWKILNHWQSGFWTAARSNGGSKINSPDYWLSAAILNYSRSN